MASFFKKSDFNWIEIDFSRWGIDRVKEKGLFELLEENFEVDIDTTVPLKFEAENFGCLIDLTLYFSLKSAHDPFTERCSVIAKLQAMSDNDFIGVADELIADFE